MFHYYLCSLDTYKRRDEKERKAKKLQQRKDKLRKLLQDERDMYEAEIKGLSFDNFSRLQSMKERSDELKTGRETARKQV